MLRELLSLNHYTVYSQDWLRQIAQPHDDRKDTFITEEFWVKQSKYMYYTTVIFFFLNFP